MTAGEILEVLKAFNPARTEKECKDCLYTILSNVLVDELKEMSIALRDSVVVKERIW